MEYSENYYTAAENAEHGEEASLMSEAFERESRRYSRRFTEEEEARLR